MLGKSVDAKPGRGFLERFREKQCSVGSMVSPPRVECTDVHISLSEKLVKGEKGKKRQSTFFKSRLGPAGKQTVLHRGFAVDENKLCFCSNVIKKKIPRGTLPTRRVAVDAEPELLLNGPKASSTSIALAHGAGAGMATPFMNYFATGLADGGFRVVRFEFPYMASRSKTGKKRPPDREPVLRETWLKVVEMLGHKRLVIGGKSMGGRIASLVADEAQVAGLVCLGYPFHPGWQARPLTCAAPSEPSRHQH